MGKTGAFVIGSLIGAAAAAVYAYVFAPAQGTAFDGAYRSRWDFAIDEGNRAAAEQEAALRRQVEEMKKRG
jgi:gas vesicle protein